MWYIEDNGQVRSWGNAKNDDFKAAAQSVITNMVGGWYWYDTEITIPDGGSLVIDHDTHEMVRKDDQGVEVDRVQMELTD